jgi:maleylacetate reductase
MHTPVEVTEAAVAAYAAAGADSVLALGGGSTIGLGKAIAVRTGAGQVAVPTTYAGSEMTDILGETEGGRKTTRRDPRIRPETVIYDVELTLGLPRGLTAASGLNAVAHAVEALYARDRNPVLSLIAAEAVRALVEALPRLADAPGDRGARARALTGAWLAGAAPGRGLWELAGRIGAPRALRELGLAEADLDRAAAIAAEDPYWNPRRVTREGVRALLGAAWAGEPPG